MMEKYLEKLNSLSGEDFYEYRNSIVNDYYNKIENINLKLDEIDYVDSIEKLLDSASHLYSNIDDYYDKANTNENFIIYLKAIDDVLAIIENLFKLDLTNYH